MTFQRAKGLLGRLAFGPLLRQVGACRRMHADLGEDDLVERRVQLAVARPREAMAGVAARGDLDRGAAGVAGKGGV